MEKLEQILENYPEAEFVKLPTEYDDCIIGVEVKEQLIVYSEELVIRQLMTEMDFEEAYEYYYFNIIGAYIGKKMPLFIETFITI